MATSTRWMVSAVQGVAEGGGEFVEVVDAGGWGAVGLGQLDEVGVA